MHVSPRPVPQDLYRISRQLAAVVVPHEYGLDEQGKLLIGSKICSELLGKLMCDLESMKVGVCWVCAVLERYSKAQLALEAGPSWLLLPTSALPTTTS